LIWCAGKSDAAASALWGGGGPTTSSTRVYTCHSVKETSDVKPENRVQAGYIQLAT
jgi:hypothetical protein